MNQEQTADRAKARFVERMGQIMQDTGMTRISGQILASIVIAEGPTSASELVDKLCISKGSLSTNVRLLEMLNIIERRSVPGERQDYFSLRKNPYMALIETQLKRIEQSAAAVAEAQTAIDGERAQKNLADLEIFYTLYRKSSIDLLKDMENYRK